MEREFQQFSASYYTAEHFLYEAYREIPELIEGKSNASKTNMICNYRNSLTHLHEAQRVFSALVDSLLDDTYCFRDIEPLLLAPQPRIEDALIVLKTQAVALRIDKALQKSISIISVLTSRLFCFTPVISPLTDKENTFTILAEAREAKEQFTYMSRLVVDLEKCRPALARVSAIKSN